MLSSLADLVEFNNLDVGIWWQILKDGWCFYRVGRWFWYMLLRLLVFKISIKKILFSEVFKPFELVLI